MPNPPPSNHQTGSSTSLGRGSRRSSSIHSPTSIIAGARPGEGALQSFLKKVEAGSSGEYHTGGASQTPTTRSEGEDDTADDSPGIASERHGAEHPHEEPETGAQIRSARPFVVTECGEEPREDNNSAGGEANRKLACASASQHHGSVQGGDNEHGRDDEDVWALMQVVGKRKRWEITEYQFAGKTRGSVKNICGVALSWSGSSRALLPARATRGEEASVTSK